MILTLHTGDARGQVPEITLDVQLPLDNPSVGSQFGRSIDISLDTVIVGGRFGGSGQGSAQVFSQNPATSSWEYQATLPTAGQTLGAGAKFGQGVGIDQNMAVVGASGSRTVYVYDRVGTAWIPDSSPSFSMSNVYEFGVDVRVSEEQIIVGSLDNAAYVYTRQAEGWTGTALAASGATSGFGGSVDISGTNAIVGASGGNTAYMYRQSGSNWVQDAAFSMPGGYFGETVSIFGDYAIVGASGVNFETGLAKIYYRNGGTWTEQAVLTAGDGMSRDLFGCSVDIGENYAIVGASGAPGSQWTYNGAAYIFRRYDDTWMEVEKLVPDSDDWFIEFGSAVALAEDAQNPGLVNVIVGAWEYDSQTGTAYAYELQTPELLIPGDANLDGIVDGADASILAFNWLKLSGAVWREGDFNGDGAVNEYDAAVLAANWQVGAPAASVPEPQALLLLAIAAACLGLMRRRMS